MNTVNDLQVYTKNESYTIWANPQTWTYYIQMTGKEMDSVVYNRASDAIEAAEMMKCLKN